VLTFSFSCVDLRRVQKILKCKAPTSAQFINEPNSNLKTALMVATRRSNEEIVRVLLHAGARIEVIDVTAGSPLHIALSQRDEDKFSVKIASMLIEKAFETDFELKLNGSPILHYIIRSKHPELLNNVFQRFSVADSG